MQGLKSQDLMWPSFVFNCNCSLHVKCIQPNGATCMCTDARMMQACSGHESRVQSPGKEKYSMLRCKKKNLKVIWFLMAGYAVCLYPYKHLFYRGGERATEHRNQHMRIAFFTSELSSVNNMTTIYWNTYNFLIGFRQYICGLG